MKIVNQANFLDTGPLIWKGKLLSYTTAHREHQARLHEVSVRAAKQCRPRQNLVQLCNYIIL